MPVGNRGFTGGQARRHTPSGGDFGRAAIAGGGCVPPAKSRRANGRRESGALPAGQWSLVRGGLWHLREADIPEIFLIQELDQPELVSP